MAIGYFARTARGDAEESFRSAAGHLRKTLKESLKESLVFNLWFWDSYSTLCGLREMTR
jgi:hypothetical protein